MPAPLPAALLGTVDVMVAVGPNMFYTVTLPCTLWFLDRGKRGTERGDRVLFIDARQTFRQIDRAHRDFTEEQLEFLANIVRLYRGEEPELASGPNVLFEQCFPAATYTDVTGLCKVATLEEIEAQGWSLNPGRYVGTEVEDLEDEVFEEKLAAAQVELRELSARATTLEAGVDKVLTELLARSVPGVGQHAESTPIDWVSRELGTPHVDLEDKEAVRAALERDP